MKNLGLGGIRFPFCNLNFGHWNLFGACLHLWQRHKCFLVIGYFSVFVIRILVIRACFVFRASDFEFSGALPTPSRQQLFRRYLVDFQPCHRLP